MARRIEATLLSLFILLGIPGTSRADGVRRARAVNNPGASELYLKHCARCHGKSGQGNGPQAARFPFRLHSFADCAWMEMRSDAVLFLLIKSGTAAVGLPPQMPAFAAHLDNQQIAELVRYVRSICR